MYVASRKRKRQRDNQPYSRFYQYLKSNFFKVHPYNSPLIGLIEDLDNSSLEDFINFKEKFYAPSNAVFVIAGDIDIDETKKLVADYFNEIPNNSVVIGALLIIISGIYVAYRERKNDN